MDLKDVRRTQQASRNLCSKTVVQLVSSQQWCKTLGPIRFHVIHLAARLQGWWNCQPPDSWACSPWHSCKGVAKQIGGQNNSNLRFWQFHASRIVKGEHLCKPMVVSLDWVITTAWVWCRFNHFKEHFTSNKPTNYMSLPRTMAASQKRSLACPESLYQRHSSVAQVEKKESCHSVPVIGWGLILLSKMCITQKKMWHLQIPLLRIHKKSPWDFGHSRRLHSLDPCPAIGQWVDLLFWNSAWVRGRDVQNWSN